MEAGKVSKGTIGQENDGGCSWNCKIANKQYKRMQNKPLIFVSNDDGFDAPGLESLVRVAREFGDVKVVAPENPMSGVGHSVTSREPLRIKMIEREDGYERYACSGTPVDCVKLGEQTILKRKPDLMVSGINHGSNAAVNIFYSGTMAAALESAIGGVPSIGFSLMNFRLDADFSICDAYVRTIIQKVMEKGMPRGICLNVNIPSIPQEEIRGIKICRQARSKWVEDYEKRIDPSKNEYYWLRGKFELMDEGRDTDDWALRNNFVSVVPVHFDFTAHHALDALSAWEMDAVKEKQRT